MTTQLQNMTMMMMHDARCIMHYAPCTMHEAYCTMMMPDTDENEDAWRMMHDACVRQMLPTPLRLNREMKWARGCADTGRARGSCVFLWRPTASRNLVLATCTSHLTQTSS